MSHIEVEDIILPAEPEYTMLLNWDDYFYIVVMLIAFIKIMNLIRN
jgi:hypothetical protein